MSESEFDDAMKVIDDYLKEVEKHLPPSKAEDIIKELKTHILDLASEQGPLTVETAKLAVKKMGDPRKLASEFVVGTSNKKVMRIELYISEDLYPIFIRVAVLMVVAIILGGIGQAIDLIYLENAGNSFQIVLGIIGTTIISIIISLILLYIAFAFLSTMGWKPGKELKIESYAERLKKQFKTKIEPKIRRPVRIGGQLFVAGFILLFGAIWIYVVLQITELTYITQQLLLFMGISIIFSGIVELAQTYFIVVEDRKSFLLETIGDLGGILLLYPLVLINLFPESLQIPVFITEGDEIEISSPVDLAKCIHWELLDPKYYSLARILSLVIIIIIIVGIIYSVLRYVRTRPRTLAGLSNIRN